MGFLISPAYGSYHFIAEIVTDLWLEPSEPVKPAVESAGSVWIPVRQERCPLSEWKKAGAGPISLRKKGI